MFNTSSALNLNAKCSVCSKEAHPSLPCKIIYPLKLRTCLLKLICMLHVEKQNELDSYLKWNINALSEQLIKMKFNKLYSSTPATKPRIFFSIYISDFLPLYLTRLRVVAQICLCSDVFLGNPTAQLHLQSLSSCTDYPLKYFSVIKIIESSNRREFSLKNEC